jgi:hypothetical protein
VRLLILLLIWLPAARALTIVPEVTVNLNQLTSDQRSELFDLEARLTEYLSAFDWDPEETRLTLRVPIAIQFRTAVETGSAMEYTALFAGGNKGDLTFDENVWRFRVPSERFTHNEDSFDSFLSMIDFHLRLVIGAEYDKLAEFGGTAMLERARRIGDMAMFSEQQEGWAKRKERLELMLDSRNQTLRSLRWVTHTAWWFRSSQHSDYEAWKTVRLALDLAAQIDNPTQLAPFFKANYRSLAEVLVKGRDLEGLQQLMRLDALDPTRTRFYQDAMSRASQ